jgi:Immunoglobulin-like domain of bacterial spore germination
MNDDDRLRQLLTEAVSHVEPEDRLEQLRASLRHRPGVLPLLHTRPWYAAAAIVAAVIGVVAFLSAVAGDRSSNPGFSSHGGSPMPSVIATGTAVPTPSPSSTGGTQAYAVYYVGTDPRDKPVLFREFHRGPDYPVNVPGSDRDVLTEAVRDAVTAEPLDPDYRSPWQRHGVSLAYATYDTTGDTLRVALQGSDLARRPSDVTSAEARAAVQQLVYTAQAAIGKRVAVHFSTSSAHSSLWGVDISHAVAAGSVLETCSHVSISDPGQGDVVSGNLRVTGVNNGFEGTVAVYLEQGGKHYLTDATIGGTAEDKLFPWAITLDLSQVTPGTYTLVAENDDASGRGNPERDTRLITVE